MADTLETPATGSIDSHPDFPEFFRQAQEEMWGTFGPRVEQAMAGGNQAAVERIMAEMERQARQRAVVATRAMVSFQGGQGGGVFGRPFARRAADTPTLTGVESQPETPPVVPPVASGMPGVENLRGLDPSAPMSVPSPVAPPPTPGSAMGALPPPSTPVARTVDPNTLGSMYQTPGYRPTSGIALGPQSIQEERDLAEEQRQANTLMNVSGGGALYRSGQHFAAGRPLEGAANIALAVTPYRPLAGLSALAGVSGLALGSDVLGSMMPSGSAEAQSSDDPRLARIAQLNAQIEAERQRLEALGKRTRDPDRLYSLSQPINQSIASLSKQRDGLQAAVDGEAAEARRAAAALEAQKKQDEQSQSASEYSAQVRRAQQIRDAILARDRRFGDTALGRVWNETGWFGPMGVTAGLGALTRLRYPNVSGRALAGAGAVEGAFSAAGPTIYDLTRTDADNPRRRALEEGAMALPRGHPDRQDWLDQAKSMPLENPVRTAAGATLRDPWLLAEMLVGGGGSGAMGSYAGGNAVGAFGRGVDWLRSLFGRRPPTGPAPGGGGAGTATGAGTTRVGGAVTPADMEFRRRNANPDPNSGGHWVAPSAPTPPPGSAPAWAAANAQQVWVSENGLNVAYSTTDSLGRVLWWRRQRGRPAERITGPPRGYRRVASAEGDSGTAVG